MVSKAKIITVGVKLKALAHTSSEVGAWAKILLCGAISVIIFLRVSPVVKGDRCNYVLLWSSINVLKLQKHPHFYWYDGDDT